VFHWGTSAAQKAMRSVIRRRCGSGGKIHSFWAMYSLRMSFWSVPRILANGMPRFSALARNMAKIQAAGALMVMEVETRSSGMPANRRSMSASVSTATPVLPTSPAARGWSESRP
jgi:hypothetical protein